MNPILIPDYAALPSSPPPARCLRKVKIPLKRSELARLLRAYWRVVAIAAIFALARPVQRILPHPQGRGPQPTDDVGAHRAGPDGACLFGVILWGLHLGFTQGLLATLIAGAAPAELCGTAFGLFSLVTGLMLLVVSIHAGLLWDQFGPEATFLTGAGFVLLAVVGLLMTRNRFGA